MDTNQNCTSQKDDRNTSDATSKGRPASDTTSFGERREQILLQS